MLTLHDRALYVFLNVGLNVSVYGGKCQPCSGLLHFPLRKRHLIVIRGYESFNSSYNLNIGQCLTNTQVQNIHNDIAYFYKKFDNIITKTIWLSP